LFTLFTLFVPTFCSFVTLFAPRYHLLVCRTRTRLPFYSFLRGVEVVATILLHSLTFVHYVARLPVYVLPVCDYRRLQRCTFTTLRAPVFTLFYALRFTVTFGRYVWTLRYVTLRSHLLFPLRYVRVSSHYTAVTVGLRCVVALFRYLILRCTSLPVVADFGCCCRSTVQLRLRILRTTFDYRYFVPVTLLRLPFLFVYTHFYVVVKVLPFRFYVRLRWITVATTFARYCPIGVRVSVGSLPVFSVVTRDVYVYLVTVVALTRFTIVTFTCSCTFGLRFLAVLTLHDCDSGALRCSTRCLFSHVNAVPTTGAWAVGWWVLFTVYVSDFVGVTRSRSTAFLNFVGVTLYSVFNTRTFCGILCLFT